ncbi:MAG: YIP1 family protein [Candidatus Omnitrophica bacterium]|nr:YIP1 family protein [Candidatus Omnitrophota bacterium]
MNPWISIWLKPRQTIRQIVDSNPRRFVRLLAIGGGIASMLMGSLPIILEAKVLFPVVVLLALVFGTLFGISGLYLFGWLYRWVGSWLGGQATLIETRAVVAWAQVPTVWVFGLWLALLLACGRDLWIKQKEAAPLSALFVGILILAYILAAVCRFVVTFKGLAEVHRFSDWKGLGTVFISPLLFITPVAVLGMIIAIGLPHFMKHVETVR